jgi:hypothetical protein
MLGPSPPYTILDSGANINCFHNDAPLSNKQPNNKPATVQVANQQNLQSTHTGVIPIERIPVEAAVAHSFDNLQHNLLGVSALTKAGCTILFEQDSATI